MLPIAFSLIVIAELDVRVGGAFGDGAIGAATRGAGSPLEQLASANTESEKACFHPIFAPPSDMRYVFIGIRHTYAYTDQLVYTNQAIS